MSCHLLEWLLILIVHFVYALCLVILGSAGKFSFFHGNLTDIDTVICLIRNHFRNNILRALNGFCHTGYAFFFVNIFLCLFLQRLTCLLCQNKLCQTIQSLFLGNTCPGLPFRTVRAVQILYHHHSLCCHDSGFQLFCKLPLFLYTL